MTPLVILLKWVSGSVNWNSAVFLIVLFLLVTDPRLRQLGEKKVDEWRKWFDTRLDDAIEAASKQPHPEIERKYFHLIRYRSAD